MLHKYKCLVQPRMDSNLFPYFADAFGRRRILDKWFYFYKNTPRDPVTIWKIKSRTDWQLQPGYNRYIGTALRSSGDWLPGQFITDDVIPDVDELKVFEHIDHVDLDIGDPSLFYEFNSKNIHHYWGRGPQSHEQTNWHQSVFDWMHENIHHRWGLEYHDKIYYINGERRFNTLFKKTKAIIKASDYPNVRIAVQELFKLVT